VIESFQSVAFPPKSDSHSLRDEHTELLPANGVAAVWELARRLDGRAFERVVEALYICRGELGRGTEALRAVA